MKTKSLKTRLISAVLVLVMMIGSLVGTTFAWFTDSVSSAGNKIVAGSLKVDLELLDKESGEWTSLKDSKDPIFNYTNWEPGFVDAKVLKVENEGSLALKWKAMFVSENELSVLADVIDVYVKAYGVLADDSTVAYPADRALEGYTKVGTLKEFVNTIEYSTYGNLLAGQAAYLGIALKMQEEAGNDYQDKAIGAFDIQIVATQMASENDSFGNDYDANAEWPVLAPGQSFTATAPVTPDADGKVGQGVTIGDTTGDIYANVPAGVLMADGANALKLTVEALTQTGSNVSATHRSEVVRSVDVHIDGVATNNTVPMLITLNAILPTGLNSNNVQLYHVENGETVAMTLVADPTNHNEFSYDPLNGNVVISIASFSEIVGYADTDAAWDGTTVSAYTVEGDTIKIATAEQFVYFRDQVDAGNDFSGKTVELTADINLNGHNFDPIGWGYDNATWNKNGAAGKVFKGTFDGGNHAIYGLYQDGWDLTNAVTGEAYTYTNCGFGLFAAALDATFENLTIDGADIRVECVETGVLVGLAQGSCTFTNINILGCKAANYQRPVGGVVGEVSPKVVNGVAQEGDASKHTFTNVYVDSNTVVGSLWGDFDAPVGGVIGAYWDDAGKTSVVMDKVTVACRLDVYNDVTSTYQWYAYRRAGMLIGNTDRADGHTATADYLTCKDVTVYYGAWADYHYCEFNEANPNWPWVRVEPGENCSGYSNPRWGRPIDPNTRNPVTDSVHSHGEGEGHLEEIPFHQLYGGGQGVYGAETHKGVSEGIYTVTYMDDGKILHVDNVIDNTKAYDCSHVDGTGIWPITNVKDANGNPPSYWVKADNTRFESINAGNTANVIVYPKWPNEYTVRCLDTYGNVAYYKIITDDNTTEYSAIADNINKTLENIQNEVDKDKKVMIIVWKNGEDTLTSVTAKNIQDAVTAKKDFILKATPQLQDTSITLTPYLDPTTGELVAYHVAKVANNDTNSNVIIPDYVGNIPVKEISKEAAAGFSNLHSITIPNTITLIGANAFAESAGLFSGGETITIYFEGTMEQWNEITKESGWDSGLGTGSRIFFLNENKKVDTSKAYLQLASKNGGTWNEKSDWSSVKEEFVGYCDCKISTTGDTSHIYVDANGNVMGRNEEGTPVNANGVVIYLKESGWISKTYTLTDGTNTYYRYRPDHSYWEGVIIQ